MLSKVWLVTGTSSGFGRRIVKSALARGDRVIATARSKEKLRGLISSINADVLHNLRTIEMDLTDGGDSIKSKVDQASQYWGGIDVLVNNAASLLVGLMEEGRNKQLRRQFETNVFGLMNMTVATLPHLRASKNASLVVIGSRSVYRPEIPGLGPYAASKAAVHALTESFMTELAPFNIRVTLVEPSGFRTEGIHNQPYFVENPIPAYDAMRAASQSLFAAMPGKQKGDPDKLAEVIVDVVRGEGVAKGRPWPPYLVLGQDAEHDIRRKTAKVLRVLDEWVDVARGVDFDLD